MLTRLCTVKFIRTWFLDSDTAMKPNLNYAQMIRGPGEQVGSHTGILYVLSYISCRNVVDIPSATSKACPK
jgi:hypothetical protein